MCSPQWFWTIQPGSSLPMEKKANFSLRLSLSPLCNTPLQACCVVRVWETFREKKCEVDYVSLGLRGSTADMEHVEYYTHTHMQVNRCVDAAVGCLCISRVHLPVIISPHMLQHTLLTSNSYKFWILIQVSTFSQGLWLLFLPVILRNVDILTRVFTAEQHSCFSTKYMIFDCQNYSNSNKGFCRKGHKMHLIIRGNRCRVVQKAFVWCCIQEIQGQEISHDHSLGRRCRVSEFYRTAARQLLTLIDPAIQLKHCETVLYCDSLEISLSHILVKVNSYIYFSLQ